MQFKFLTIAALVTLAAATPTRRADCATGELRCCKTTGKATDAGPAAVLAAIGVVLEDVNVLVGLDCSPIEIIDVGGSCTASPVCCQNNSFGSAISIGCVPVIV